MGTHFSKSFCVSNCVKHGDINSPVPFNVYMDDLYCALNCSNIRGHIGGEIVNLMSYAGDRCLICLLSAGMQKLLMCAQIMPLSIAYYIVQTSCILCILKLPQYNLRSVHYILLK